MKDTNNLLDYNCWSGTDYSNDRSGFYTVGSTLQSTNEWSDNGENSLKIIGDINNAVDINHLTNFNTGDIMTVDLTVYAPTTPVRCNIRSNEGTIVSVDVPVSNTPQKISVSGIIPSNINWITLRTFFSGDGYFYMDNIKVTIS